MSQPLKKVPIHLQSSAHRLLIKNGTIVNDTGITEADIFIEEGQIKEIGRNLIIPGGTRTIDANNRYVFPGGIDPHTHFQFEFMGTVTCDDFYQGTKAAVAGGTTTIIDFVMQRDKNESLMCAYDRYRQNADAKVCCDYALHVGIQNWSDPVREQMQILTTKYGVNSYKFFMAYNFRLHDDEIYQLMDTCKQLGALPMVHAENGDLIVQNTKKLLANGVTGPEGHEMSRNEDVEAEAVNRVCIIAKQLECPLYIVHLMCPEAVDAMCKVKATCKNNRIFGETVAAALGTDGTHCHQKDFNHAAGHIISPPLRSDPDTPLKLMKLLASNKIQLTGSDNCTFKQEQKAIGKKDFSKIPNGVNGVEDRLSVVWQKGYKTGLLDLCRFVAVTSTNAAKIFNLYPRKGTIQVGSDADLVIWDPLRKRTISAKTHHHAHDFNIFEGMVIEGAPEYVIVNGRVCVDEGELKVLQGYGKYLPCAPFCQTIYKSQVDEVDEEHEAAKESEQNNKVNGDGDVMMHVNVDINADVRPISPTLSMISESKTEDRFKELANLRANMQSSRFSVSGEIDQEEQRSSIRVKNPPGGKSSGGFW